MSKEMWVNGKVVFEDFTEACRIEEMLHRERMLGDMLDNLRYEAKEWAEEVERMANETRSHSERTTK